MLPILELVTEFLTNKDLRWWWWRALLGKPKKNKDTNEWELDDPEGTEQEKNKKVDEIFMALADIVQIIFVDFLPSHEGTACTTRSLSLLSKQCQPQDPWTQKTKEQSFDRWQSDEYIYIGLYSALRTWFRVLNTETPAYQLMATNLGGAITLTHEIAHAAFKAIGRKNNKCIIGPGMPERKKAGHGSAPSSKNLPCT
ncbi:hypothetical protein EJ04DRAFT_564176 [Polyplosphaeria fusca]|uniref:Uncharacterized protein n=1 Tax=Polyplosphaeria fusca TaxID=682080 RepID=A0A9P4QXV3_9PLEO|nr:hypothetical protein EJ04DRAFT_564176 [Polyplosphaeria fusca]